MSGLTNNTSILNADNQLIVSQNEQTTKLEEIEQAILSIKRVITSYGGGSGESGTGLGPSGDQDLYNTPVEDFTSEQSSNRCEVANFVFQGIYDVFYKLYIDPFDEAMTAGLAITSGSAGALVAASVFGLTALAPALAFVIVGAIGGLIAAQSSTGTIVGELDNKKQEIINALYFSQNVIEARAAFIDNVSLSTIEKYYLGLICHGDLLGVLFMSDFQIPAGYEPASPCEVSGDSLSKWRLVAGGEDVLPDRAGVNWVEFDSVEYSVYNPGQSNNGYQYLYLYCTDDQASVAGLQFTGTGVTGLSEGVHFYATSLFTDVILADSTIPIDQTLSNCRAVQARTLSGSGQTLTMRIAQL